MTLISRLFSVFLVSLFVFACPPPPLSAAPGVGEPSTGQGGGGGGASSDGASGDVQVSDGAGGFTTLGDYFHHQGAGAFKGDGTSFRYMNLEYPILMAPDTGVSSTRSYHFGTTAANEPLSHNSYLDIGHGLQGGSRIHYFTYDDVAAILDSKTIAGGLQGNTRGVDSSYSSTPTVTVHDSYNTLSIRRHATDCTAVTDGVDGEFCKNDDDGMLYLCEGSSPGAACDTVVEWVAMAPLNKTPYVLSAHRYLTTNMVLGTANALPINDDGTIVAASSIRANTDTRTKIFFPKAKYITGVEVNIGLAANAPATTEGCKVQVSKNGSTITGLTFDWGDTVLDGDGEAQYKEPSSATSLSGTDYLQVILAEPTAGKCPSAASCACEGGTNFDIFMRIYARDSY